MNVLHGHGKNRVFTSKISLTIIFREGHGNVALIAFVHADYLVFKAWNKLV